MYPLKGIRENLDVHTERKDILDKYLREKTGFKSCIHNVILFFKVKSLM